MTGEGSTEVTKKETRITFFPFRVCQCVICSRVSAIFMKEENAEIKSIHSAE